jgi:hypothetical protein
MKRILLAALLGAALLVCDASAANIRFLWPVDHGPAVDVVTGIAAADVNGDGRLDAAALTSCCWDPELEREKQEVHVFFQRPDGTLAPPVVARSDRVYWSAIRAIDFDGNGTQELLAGHENGVQVIRWSAGNTFSAQDYPLGHQCLFMAVADVDADGAGDAVCHSLYGQASLLRGDGQGGFSPPHFFLTPDYGNPLSTKQVTLADVTGDQRPDLLLVGGTKSFYVMANNGFGGFFPAVAYPLPSEFNSRGIEAMDVDGDGINELVLSSGGNGAYPRIHLYRRSPGGYLSLWKSFQTYEGPDAIFVHDVDRDGRKDLLVAHRGWEVVGWYRMLASGLSTTERFSQYVARNYKGYSANLTVLGELTGDGCADMANATMYGLSVLVGDCSLPGDFNADNKADVLWYQTSTGASALWLGADSKLTQALARVSNLRWSIKATGDFDGDGRRDVFWRNEATGANVIWRSGNAASQIPVAQMTNTQWKVAGAGDFDGDGRDDLLWREGPTGMLKYWEGGDASGEITLGEPQGSDWKLVGIGDFDGNGAAALVLMNSVTGAVRVNEFGAIDYWLATVSDHAWQPVGVGDFNSDGRSDLLWRHAVKGTNVIWRGGNAADSQFITTVTNLQWKVAAVSDYDGDGYSDIFWRNHATGANVIWRSANSKKQQPVAAVTNQAWRVVP